MGALLIVIGIIALNLRNKKRFTDQRSRLVKRKKQLVDQELKNKENDLARMSAYIVSKNDLLNSIVSDLQKATGEKQGVFGKQFSWEQYQNYKKIYLDQKKSASQAIKNTNIFLSSFKKNFLIITTTCKKIDNWKISSWSIYI